MADIANIGFRVDTTQLDTARQKVGQLFTDIGTLSGASVRVNTAVTTTAQTVSQGADKQVQAYARARKAINDAAQQAQTAATAQVQAMSQLGLAVTGVADRVDNSTARQVAAHGRSKKAIDQLRNVHHAGLVMISAGFTNVADKVENSTQRQVAAHTRTRNAMQKMATESRNAASAQIDVLRRIASETQKMSRAVTNSLHNQKVQTELLGRAMLDLNNGVRTSVTGKQLLNQTLVDSSKKTQDFRVALLGTANAVAVLDGPLGGVASRISSFGILVGRFGIAGGALAATIAGISLASKAAVAEFNKMETSILRLDRVVELAGGRIAGTGGQIYGMASDLAFATLEDVEGSLAGINNIIGLSSVNADNMGRIMSNAADLSAMGFGDLASMAQVLGRAVQDPERAMSRLNRRMNLFTESEIEVIKLMSEMGRESEALDMFLAKIESRFEGISKTGAAIPYALDTLGQAVPRLMAAMGGDILKATGLDDAITWLANKAQEAATKTDIRQGTASLETQEQFALKQALELRKQLNAEEQRSGRFRSEGKITELKSQIQVWDDLAVSASAAAEAQAKAAEASSRQEELVANAKAVKNLTELLKEQNRVRQEMSPDEIRQQDLREEYGLAGAGEAVMVDDQLVNVDEALKALDQQKTFDKMRTDAAKLVSETDNLTARNQLLAKSMLDLENMDTREAQLRVMQAELKGVPELAGAYDLVTQSLEDYVAARDTKDEGAASQREARTMNRIGDALRNQTDLLKIQNNLQGLSSAELKVQEFVQAKISEMRGQMSVEDVLKLYKDEVAELQRQYDLSEEIAKRTAQRAAAKQGLDASRDQLATLEATLDVLQMGVVKTKENAQEFAALVDLAKLMGVETQGMTQAQLDDHNAMVATARAALDVSRNIDETTNSINRATTAASALESALTAAAAKNLSLQDRATLERRNLDLLKEGVPLIEARAQAEADLLRIQLERQAREAGELTPERVEEINALTEALFQNTVRSETAAAATSDYTKALEDGAKDVDKFAESVRDLLLSLDPAAQAAFDLSEKVDTLNQAQAAGLITTQQYRDAVQQLSSEFEASQDPIANFYQELEKLQDMDRLELGALENAQDALADFLFDPFAEGIEGMVGQFADAMRRMVAEALSAKIMESAMGAFGLGGASGGASGGDGGAAALTSAATTLQASGGTLTTSGGTLASAGGVLSSSGGLLSGSAAALSAAAAALSASAAAASVSNAVSSIPMMDKGGSLAPGQAGIVGEIGPELVFGPATVIGREQTQNIYRAQEEERKAMEEAKAAKSEAVGLSGMAGMSGGLIQMLLMMLAQGNGLGLGSLFAGLFDQGGYIPPGKMGIAGELGPELIAGPANVTSRRETSSMMAQKAPEMNAKIINVLDPSIVGQYMNSADGEKLILNVLSENGVL